MYRNVYGVDSQWCFSPKSKYRYTITPHTAVKMRRATDEEAGTNSETRMGLNKVKSHRILSTFCRRLYKYQYVAETIFERAIADTLDFVD